MFGYEEGNFDTDTSAADTDSAGSDDDYVGYDLPPLLDCFQEDEDAAIAFYREVDQGIFNIIVVEEALERLGDELAALGWRRQGVKAPLTP